MDCDLLLLTAEWCGPCKKIAPHVEELAQQHVDVIFIKVCIVGSKLSSLPCACRLNCNLPLCQVNVEENEEVVVEAGVQGLPTFHVYKDAAKVSGGHWSRIALGTGP